MVGMRKYPVELLKLLKNIFRLLAGTERLED